MINRNRGMTVNLMHMETLEHILFRNIIVVTPHGGFMELYNSWQSYMDGKPFRKVDTENWHITCYTYD